MMKTSLRRFVLTMSVIVGLIAGCAFDLMDVRYTPATIQSLAQPERTFVLTGDVLVSQAPCGYSRTLRRHTRWELMGAIPAGDVFRSRDQTFTVECSNVFEASLVVSGDRLVGFFLPVQHGFVPIADPIPLPIEP
jgi:hypothetical protein